MGRPGTSGTTIHGETSSAKPLLVTQRSLGTQEKGHNMPIWEIPNLSSETWDSANQPHAGKRLYNTSANICRGIPRFETETSWEQLILLNWVHVRRVSDGKCTKLSRDWDASCLRYALNPRTPRGCHRRKHQETPQTLAILNTSAQRL